MAVALTPGQQPAVEEDKPRVIVAPVAFSDKIFRGILRAAGFTVFLITGLILVFLIIRAASALRAAGLGFFTTSTWFISTNQFGIAAILPLSILAALFALFILMPRILGFDSWLSHHMAFIPLFQFRLANYSGEYANATFIAGIAVSLLVIPIVASLSRQVFSQAPQGEREAAYALGSTRWGMIRTVVLPYGRSGVIGASMLGLGRALGETIVMAFILSPVFGFNYHVLESGGNSVTVMIANHFFVAGAKEISALMAGGLVLFVMTLIVNTFAAMIINRSRSGASASAD